MHPTVQWVFVFMKSSAGGGWFAGGYLSWDITNLQKEKKCHKTPCKGRVLNEFRQLKQGGLRECGSGFHTTGENYSQISLHMIFDKSFLTLFDKSAPQWSSRWHECSGLASLARRSQLGRAWQSLCRWGWTDLCPRGSTWDGHSHFLDSEIMKIIFNLKKKSFF